MSALSRTCLRLAACAALRGKTMAAENVFDSRLGEVVFATPETFAPLITVYTEEQKGPALSSNNGGPPFRTSVQLILEMAMGIAQRENDDAEFVVGFSSTDGDLEANLDLLEAQVRICLFEAMEPNSVAFRKSMVRATEFSSVRFTQADAQDRMAIRYVTLEIEVVDESLIDWTPGATGLDRLPPTFRAVASSWTTGTPERAIASAIADAIVQPMAPILKAMRINPTDDPPASGPVETWTPPTPEPPAAIDGLPYRAEWNLDQ